jgi:putative phosphoribosyl transferase
MSQRQAFATFGDRRDAGLQLAQALVRYQDEPVLVLAIPRGGAEVGYQVAKHLGAEFSLLVSRKLPFPYNPEAGFGAVAEDGSTFIFDDAARGLSAETVERIVQREEREIQRRIAILRGGQPLPEIAGKTVILTDDGIAMGSTMRASIQLCRNQGAAKVIVAVPVAGPRVAAEIATLADDVVILVQPPFFRAVAQVYRNWYDVSDREVLEIMARWNDETRSSGEDRITR